MPKKVMMTFFSLSGPSDYAEKSYDDLFFHFSFRNLKSVCQELSKWYYTCIYGSKNELSRAPRSFESDWIKLSGKV